MKSIIKSNQKVIIVLLAFAFVFGFTSIASAYDFDQPNYGDPITIDGNITDWDLTADFFSVMYHDADPSLVIESDAYLRYSHAQNTLYIMVLSRNGQNMRTSNGQIVDLSFAGIPGITRYVPPYLLPNFAWVNLNSEGTLAEGWEAQVTWSDQEVVGIQIHALFEGNDKAWINLPLSIYRWDYGDLPDSYGTYELSSGPRHSAGTLRLGPQVDGESDGQPDTNPILDDINGRNDEDGVLAIGNWRNGTPTFQYTVNGCTGTCFLNAWVDWGNDGVFDVGDVLFTNRPVTTDTATYSFDLPAGIEFPSTFNFRFRLCDVEGDGATVGCDTPHALASDDAPFGEVEDYQWSFDPNALTLNSFSAAPAQNSTILYLLVGSIAVILVLGTATLIQKRKNG